MKQAVTVGAEQVKGLPLLAALAYDERKPRLGPRLGISE
jgi:hypothetical protein